MRVIVRLLDRLIEPSFFRLLFLVVILATYGVMMFVYPLMVGGTKHLHEVLITWQTLNASVIAFLTALLLLNMQEIGSERQRRRELRAARAQLPHALSNLSNYLRECGALLSRANEIAQAIENRSSVRPGRNVQDFDVTLSAVHVPIFERCISLADEPLAEYLSHILSCLQVNDSRLTSMQHQCRQHGTEIIGTLPILGSTVRLAELQVLVDGLYDYARGEANFSRQTLSWEQFANAYRCLRIRVNEVKGLEDLTRSVLNRFRSSWRLENDRVTPP